MPFKLNGQTYYRTAEVSQMIGLSKMTLLRWIRSGILGEAEHRDRRGWRLFTADEVNGFAAEANRIVKRVRLK
jgi:excisionase family DNA binding protein